MNIDNLAVVYSLPAAKIEFVRFDWNEGYI
jgi:hypothetical protein